MSKKIALPAADIAWLADTFARNRATFGGWSMEAEGEGEGDKPETFTQADVDAAVEKIAAKIRAEERRKVSEKYADYDDLKAKAEGAKTAEDRITELEKSIEAATREALRRRVQAAHGISDEDADLFLTGTDEDSLTAQAKRLADREAERKQKNNVSPREGTNTSGGKPDQLRGFTRDLFSRASADD